MMTDHRSCRRTVLTLLAAGLLAGCGGGLGGGGNNGGNPTPTAKLLVTPGQGSVEAGQTLEIQVATENIAEPIITFTVVPPVALQTATPAEIAAQYLAVDANGLVTVGDEAEPGLLGQVIVRETTSRLRYDLNLLIVPPIQTITISPERTSVLAGQTAAFTATAIDFFNDDVPVLLPHWNVTGGIGTIDASGVLTATRDGVGTVEAIIGLAQPGVAEVTVIGSITGLAIQPAGNPVEIEAGTSRQFTARVSDDAGNSTTVDATWRVEPAGIGTISATGLFRATGAPGATGTITATAEDETATMQIRLIELLTPPAGRPANVFGVVRDTTPAAVAGATVTAHRAGDDVVVATATTDANGLYGLFLPVGTYTLRAFAGNLAATRTGLVVPSQDTLTRLDLTVTEVN